MIFLGFSSQRPLPERQWAVASVHATNLHKSIFMLATAEMAMGSGFRRNTVSKLILKNRCTGSTIFSNFNIHPNYKRFAPLIVVQVGRNVRRVAKEYFTINGR